MRMKKKEKEESGTTTCKIVENWDSVWEMSTDDFSRPIWDDILSRDIPNTKSLALAFSG